MKLFEMGYGTVGSCEGGPVGASCIHPAVRTDDDGRPLCQQCFDAWRGCKPKGTLR